MYTDNNLVLSTAQSITATAWSTNTIDLGSAHIRDLGAGTRMSLQITNATPLLISAAAPAVTDAVILDFVAYLSSASLATDSGTSVTCTSASPGVVTWTAHGLLTGDPVTFTGGTAPTGLASNTVYYAIRTGANTLNLAATPGGSAINTSSTGTALFMASLRPVAQHGPINAYFMQNSKQAGVALPLPDMLAERGLRYLTLRYSVAGSNLTGTWNANLVLDTQDGRKFYTSGFTIS